MSHKARTHSRPEPAPGAYTTCGGCGKRGYESRAKARAARRQMQRRIPVTEAGKRLSTYRCETGMWHVGHEATTANRNDPRLRWLT